MGRKKIIGPKKEKVAGGWRKVFNGYVHDFIRTTQD